MRAALRREVVEWGLREHVAVLLILYILLERAVFKEHPVILPLGLLPRYEVHKIVLLKAVSRLGRLPLPLGAPFHLLLVHVLSCEVMLTLVQLDYVFLMCKL